MEAKNGKTQWLAHERVANKNLEMRAETHFIDHSSRLAAHAPSHYPGRRLASSARASMKSDSSSQVLATSAHGGGSSGGTAVSRLVGGATSGALELICFHPGALFFLRGALRRG